MKISEVNERLQAAMHECESAERINIKGKNYAQVATRVAIFRKHFLGEGRITFRDRDIGPEVVRMRAVIEVALSADGFAGFPEWVPIAEGQAEEYRSASNVNKTSALENCETSAMGRALAQLGLLGGEYASANEVSNAIESKPAAGELRDTITLTKKTFDACADYESFRKEWMVTHPLVREAFTKQEGAYLNALRDRLQKTAAVNTLAPQDARPERLPVEQPDPRAEQDAP